jgi:hypothetical protein
MLIWLRANALTVIDWMRARRLPVDLWPEFRDRLTEAAASLREKERQLVADDNRSGELVQVREDLHSIENQLRNPVEPFPAPPERIVQQQAQRPVGRGAAGFIDLYVRTEWDKPGFHVCIRRVTPHRNPAVYRDISTVHHEYYFKIKLSLPPLTALLREMRLYEAELARPLGQRSPSCHLALVTPARENARAILEAEGFLVIPCDASGLLEP